MSDDIEVHFDARRSQLILSCGVDAFARVRNAIFVASNLHDVPDDVVPTGVELIVIMRGSPASPASRRRDRVALFGCAVIGFGLMFVFVVGVATIAGWVQ